MEIVGLERQRAGRATIEAAESAGRSIETVQLYRELAQRCITDSKKYLSAKEGQEFDKCFRAMQIAKHAAMHTKLLGWPSNPR